MPKDEKKNVGLSQISPTWQTNKNLTLKDMAVNFWGSWTELYSWVLDEEYNSDLSWTTWLWVYEKMRRSDSQVYATLLSMELPIRSTSWFIESSTDENWEIQKEDEEMQEFVEKLFFERLEQNRDDLLREILTMLPFGFSVFEKIFKLEDDKIRLKKLWWRKQETIDKWETLEETPWVTQMLTSVLKEWENEWENYVSIPAEKLVIFSFRREWDNYEWISVLRSAYKNRYIKDKLLIFDSIRQERWAWFPIITLPNWATQDDKDEALNIVKNIRTTQQTWVVLPWENWKFEFAQINAWGQSNIFESVKFHNREISKNILAQFLELWATESWSRALSEDQSDLFLLWLEAVAKQIEDTLNRYLVKEMIDLNFDTDRYPKIKHKKLWSVSYDKLSAVLSQLATSNIIRPDDDLEEFIRTELDLPAKKELTEEKLLEQERLEQKVKQEKMPNEDDEIMDKKEKEVPDKEVKGTEFDEFYFSELSKLINNDFMKGLSEDVKKKS